MQLVILAGGKGTRLSSLTQGLPKALAPISGKPLLRWQLEWAKREGIERVLLLLGTLSERIVEATASWSDLGLQIESVVEDKPLGTAGALLSAFPFLEDRFVLLYGDVFLDIDLPAMVAAHREKNAGVTLLCHPNDHPQDSDLVETDDRLFVQRISGYPHPEGTLQRNLVNSALSIFNKEILRPWIADISKADLAKVLVPQFLNAGIPVLAYKSREYIKDMGTPARLHHVTEDVANDVPAERNVRHPLPCVFFDRDGVLNEDRAHISKLEDIVLLPGAAEAIRMVNRKGWLAVVITNQPVVARGECSEEQLNLIHAKLEWELGKAGAYLDEIYYCPHHPDSGFAGERAELKFVCKCRKPASGLYLRAASELNIDLTSSWVIGDQTSDLEAARRLDMRSILVTTGFGGKDGKYPAQATFEITDVLSAVSHVIGQSSLHLEPTHS